MNTENKPCCAPNRPDILIVTLAAAGILAITIMGARQSLGLFIALIEIVNRAGYCDDQLGVGHWPIYLGRHTADSEAGG